MKKIEQEIAGALARGYCRPETEKELINTTLCQCQLKEVMAVQKDLSVEWLSCLPEEIKHYINCQGCDCGADPFNLCRQQFLDNARKKGLME